MYKKERNYAKIEVFLIIDLIYALFSKICIFLITMSNIAIIIFLECNHHSTLLVNVKIFLFSRIILADLQAGTL